MILYVLSDITCRCVSSSRGYARLSYTDEQKKKNEKERGGKERDKYMKEEEEEEE